MSVRRGNPRPPNVSRAVGFCSLCPSLDGIPVVHITHEEQLKGQRGERKMVPIGDYLRICLRCARLIGKAAKNP